MALTVAEVIGLSVVQAGVPEVLSRRRWDDPVRWVHVGDVADLTSWLQGGELVLTTGAALRDAPIRYLRGIADAGRSGRSSNSVRPGLSPLLFPHSRRS